jgi:hypothetical protein
MLVTYKPDDQEPRSWTFNPGRVRLSEAAAVEKQYGSAWEQFAAEVQAGSAKARRVLLWFLMRRDHPTLRFEDTPDLYLDELVLEHSLDELRMVRDRVAKAGLSESEESTALSILDDQIAQAEVRPELGGGTGKAISETEH